MEPENIYEIENEEVKPDVKIPLINIPHTDGSPSNFRGKINDNSLYIVNHVINKSIYIYKLVLMII